MDGCCYCNAEHVGSYMIACESCKSSFHIECLKSGKPSPIQGDIFFEFTCSGCSPTKEEQLQRMKLPWVTVVHLALYNLQLEGGSKCGYFKWKDHICAYIDRHWHNFFDCVRKKSVTWHGTVAGTLSSGSPQYFVSGSNILKQPGWWKLAVCKPPTLHSVLQLKSVNSKLKNGKQTYKEPLNSVLEEPRNRPKMSPIEAAMQRKARRDSFGEKKQSKKQKCGSDSSAPLPMHQPQRASPVSQIEIHSEKDSDINKKQPLFSESVCALLGTVDSDSDIEIDPCSLSPLPTGSQDVHQVTADSGGSMPETGNQETDGWDQILANLYGDAGTASGELNTLVIQPESEAVIPDIAENVTIKPEICEYDMGAPYTGGELLGQDSVEESSVLTDNLTATVKEEQPSPVSSEHTQFMSFENYSSNVYGSEVDVPPVTSCDTSQYQSEAESVSETDDHGSYSTEVSDASRPQSRKKRCKSTQPEQHSRENKSQYTLMSVYEEKQLLKSLMNLENAMTNNSQARRLKRKLHLREIKRERGLALFDLDAMMNRLVQQKSQLYGLQFTATQPTVSGVISETKPVLDSTSEKSPQSVRILDRFQNHQPVRMHAVGASFLNKLVGTEDDQLQSIHSPYTSRLLKPFIRRDYETIPLKLKLLMEIQAYPHRSDPSWEAPIHPPIDYCYVRPQHIPTVNSYCKEFFWPGIDMSECLHYPDFSCIAMYRKFVVGFAFMVPDVKHNEAYISFIFTHPEWRGAGIAKFMVYHLIQTCMGKDVTLHVSANNPAMLLYQKFGFKPEEFILDFYDKYFPLDSKESRHAFFLRLRR